MVLMIALDKQRFEALIVFLGIYYALGAGLRRFGGR